MKIATFIFARGGSKGLPGKNIKLFCGKPLIAWAIEQSLAVKGVHQVYVSTDSEEIAKIAREYGAVIPFIRPSELSGDQSPEWLAWKHALKFFEKSQGYLPDVFLSVPVTSPLRSPKDIESCLHEFSEHNVDAVITISESRRNPYFNMVELDKTGYCHPAINVKEKYSRRQDAKEVFDITTVAYAVRPNFIYTCDRLFDGNIRAVQIPIERSIDIDTLLDFEIAEFIYQKREKKNVDV